MQEVQKSMDLYQMTNPRHRRRCDVDPGCGDSIECTDHIYRCPQHAAEAGFCCICGTPAPSGVCIDCAAVNGIEQDDDDRPPQHVVCANCEERIEWYGPLDVHSICPNCGGYVGSSE